MTVEARLKSRAALCVAPSHWVLHSPRLWPPTFAAYRKVLVRTLEAVYRPKRSILGPDGRDLGTESPFCRCGL
jgi:hypothetical protein